MRKRRKTIEFDSQRDVFGCEDLLSEIFSFITNVSELCILARVCRDFRSAANQSTTWYIGKLQGDRLNQMKYYLRPVFPQVIRLHSNKELMDLSKFPNVQHVECPLTYLLWDHCKCSKLVSIQFVVPFLYYLDGQGMKLILSLLCGRVRLRKITFRVDREARDSSRYKMLQAIIDGFLICHPYMSVTLEDR